ncbi:MAG: PorP/SprF family type IX secretion system membrane protein, partial [Bacteroidales bacterium]|nr:PorP/SprF family type IX secretion system membrane protein [Bacteroidales bacterium]
AFGKIFAQDDALFTQFYANRLYFNPAATGFSDKFLASLTYRSQWAGDRSLSRHERPSYMLFSAAQFFADQRSGVGLTVYNARQHVQNNLLIKASYAYHLQVDEEAWLAMGVNVGLLSRGIRNGQTAGGDLINATNTMSDLGFGVEFYTPEITVGLSVQHIPAIIGSREERQHTHFYFYASYRYAIDDEWMVIPTVFLRNASFVTTVDAAVRVSYLNMFQLGVAWRRDAVALLFGISWEDFSLGYSFDIHTGHIRGARPSHEIVLSYRTQLIQRSQDTRLERMNMRRNF